MSRRGLRQHRGATWILGAVALAALFASSPAVSAATGADSPVVLVAPAGWAQSADGSVVAETDKGLRGAVPTVPRARLVTRAKGPNGVKALLKEVKAAARLDPELLDEPTQLTIAGNPAVAVTLVETQRSHRIVRRSITVTGSDGSTVVVVLEAPEDRWADAAATLESAITPSGSP